MALGITVFNVFYVVFFVPESKTMLGQTKWSWMFLNPFRSFGKLIHNRLVVVATIIYFLTNFSEGFADVMVVFWKYIGLDAFQIGMLYSLLGLW